VLQRLYKNVAYEDMHVEVLEGEAAIAREFDDDVRQYITNVLEKRGVKIRLKTRAKKIEPGEIFLPDGSSIESKTIVLGTGVVPSPIVVGLAIEKDKKGRAVTDATMRCKGRSDLWALGDCAEIPDPDGKPYPELAQHALREARLMAKNITAALRGQPLEPFVYKNKGTLAALGHAKGVAKLYSKIQFHGFIAWWIWRSYYLMQMRGSRRIRIMLDWTLALFLKNDIVQLDLQNAHRPLETPKPPGEEKPATTAPIDKPVTLAS
jgi:NADH dehydrogenase